MQTTPVFTEQVTVFNMKKRLSGGLVRESFPHKKKNSMLAISMMFRTRSKKLELQQKRKMRVVKCWDRQTGMGGGAWSCSC